MSTLSPILGAADLGRTPLVVLALYMVMLLVLGVMGYLCSKTSEEDYYLAGRGQGVLVTVLTIMATFFSSAAMMGIPGLIYRDGTAFLFFALNLPVSGAVIYLLGSRIRKMGQLRGYVTPADMIADYYGGSRALRLLVALVGFLYVIPYIVMQIKAGGYLAQRLFPDAEIVTLLGREFGAFELGTIALSVLTMLYVLVGGMRSVAWTDVIQGFLLLTGMLVAGLATVVALGGVGAYFEELTKLPAAARSMPGVSGVWSPWKLLTICIFASLATMIQPGQWMRFYAAKSAQTLRRSALIFALVLPGCFLFGVMVVALGAHALYPPAMVDGVLMPHPSIGTAASEFDQVVVAMLQEHVPLLLGATLGTIAVAVILVATLLSLWLVGLGQTNADFQPLALIASLMFVAIGFSCQLLPLALDCLFLRRGTPTGAIAGMISGILVVFLFTPFPTLILGQDVTATWSGITGTLGRLFDVGFCGFVVNATVFALVSRFTEKLPPDHVAKFAEEMDA